MDDRQLSPAQGAGSFGDFGGQSGGSPSEPDAPRSPNDLVDGCADLNTDGVPDCQTNILQNATFASDTSDWRPDANTELDWDPENALADLPSGSAKLSAMTPRASATQCVPLSGKELVVAYSNAYVVSSDGDSGGDDADAGMAPQAELEVSFFDGAGCTGTSDASFHAPASTVRDAWVVIQAGSVSSATTQSVSIALVALGGSSSEVTAYFDNVMLEATPQ